jgi:hypothetical protein
MSASFVQPFGREIWIVDGPCVSVIGFRYPTRMAIIRLADAALFIWSPVALSEDLRASLLGLGDVRFIIAPNALHHLYLKQWQDAFPEAEVYAAPGLRERRRDIVFTGDLADTPAPAWAGQIDQAIVRGNLITSEVVFFHRASATALFTDLIQNFEPGWFKGWRALIARADRLVSAEPTAPHKFRLVFVDRAAARAAMRRIFAWPAEKVLMAHGRPIKADGSALIKRAFAWLRA